MTRRDIALRYFEGHKEYTDARVKAGIEQHRKGNVTLSIKDSDGNALKGAKVFVNHKKHDCHGKSRHILFRHSCKNFSADIHFDTQQPKIHTQQKLKKTKMKMNAAS